MSDSKAPGEPVEEPTTPDDVVGQANEGLADAEAARRDPQAASGDEVPWYERDDVPLDDEPAVEPAAAASTPAEPVAAEPVASEPVVAERVASEPVVAEPVVHEPVVASEPPAETLVIPSEPAADQRTEVIAPAAVAPAATVAAARSPQPIFVQAPEPPRPRGNRAAAAAIGLLAAVCFAVLYLGAWVVVDVVAGKVEPSGLGKALADALVTWALWVPVAVFFLAFWLLGAIINRGRWGLWVVFGLLVGLASYGGHLLGQLFQAPFWSISASQGRELVQGQLWVPLAIAAFVIGRELTIWFGAWVAARGKRVSELNYEAQREYERTIEAGPTIVPSAQG